jgi:hypothetical protein
MVGRRALDRRGQGVLKQPGARDVAYIVRGRMTGLAGIDDGRA